RGSDVLSLCRPYATRSRRRPSVATSTRSSTALSSTAPTPAAPVGDHSAPSSASHPLSLETSATELLVASVFVADGEGTMPQPRDESTTGEPPRSKAARSRRERPRSTRRTHVIAYDVSSDR